MCRVEAKSILGIRSGKATVDIDETIGQAVLDLHKARFEGGGLRRLPAAYLVISGKKPGSVSSN